MLRVFGCPEIRISRFPDIRIFGNAEIWISGKHVGAGDTAANDGALATLEYTELPTAMKTIQTEGPIQDLCCDYRYRSENIMIIFHY